MGRKQLEQELCDLTEKILVQNPPVIELKRLRARLQWLVEATERQLDAWRELQAGRMDVSREFTRVATAALHTARAVVITPESTRAVKDDSGGVSVCKIHSIARNARNRMDTK